MPPADVVKGLSPEQIRSTLALATVPTHYVHIVIPAGKTMTMGRVSTNKLGGLQDTIQFHVDIKRASVVLYGDVRKIGPRFGISK